MKIVKLLLVIFLCVGCNKTEISSDTSNQILDREIERSGIEETRTSFELAIKEGRYDDIQTFTTDDFIAVGPGSVEWNAMYALGEERGSFPYDSIAMNPIETVIVSDSIAYDFGTSKVYYTDQNGQAHMLEDTFLAILKKDKDGVWKLHRELASSRVN